MEWTNGAISRCKCYLVGMMISFYCSESGLVILSRRNVVARSIEDGTLYENIKSVSSKRCFTGRKSHAGMALECVLMYGSRMCSHVVLSSIRLCCWVEEFEESLDVLHVGILQRETSEL
jgi:hypothetical protein